MGIKIIIKLVKYLTERAALANIFLSRINLANQKVGEYRYFGGQMTVNFTKISSVFAPVNSNSISDLRFHYRNATVTSLDSVHPFSFPFGVGQFSTFTFRFRHLKLPTIRRKLASPTASLPMFSQNQVMGDVVATALTGGIALSALRFWEETAKRGLFDQVSLKLELWLFMQCL